MSEFFQFVPDDIHAIIGENFSFPANADSIIKAPPASASVVENLPVITIEEKGKECIICLKEFEVGSKGMQMPCKHTYHTECILHWLSKTNSCPLCREELPTDDQFYEEYRKMKKREAQRKEMLKDLHNSMFT
ncbi:PREDICTED: E3 ubiquitin-protein ligase RNF181 [Nicrophorus vespilloides]|uniref:E3 ubiquitin-protein ligase RNF181 n=1 Tax=Nicrophorus vespilloides TaxID=110193 RepID=A0ABM1MF10_NICVS|nr:PREDICTED: E3 ubiquitin-protein ligase RNF181 [Nicrophorus vespilloides]